MTSYRVISEPYQKRNDFLPAHRAMRGDSTVERRVTTVDAPDVIAALGQAINERQHSGRSIISLEEMLPQEVLYFSDEELTLALRQPEGGTPAGEPDKVCPDDYEDQAIYGTVTFNDAVEEVAKVLRETLIPGLHFTLISSDDGDQYVVLEIRDEATGTYRSTTSATKDLIQDRNSVGWDGVLSIAKALINAVSELV